jgi:hypothetical protein
MRCPETLFHNPRGPRMQPITASNEAITFQGVSRSSKVNRILVGTNFSPSADKAVSRAGNLAQAFGGQLELVYVASPRDLPVYRVSG